MKLQTDFSNTLQDPLFKILKETVDEVGIESYVIGGFVRDLILGRVQKKDIDIVGEFGVSIGTCYQNYLKFFSLLPVSNCFHIEKSCLNITFLSRSA